MSLIEEAESVDLSDESQENQNLEQNMIAIRKQYSKVSTFD